jgi:type IV secretory pathway VirB9-like protein
MRLDILAIRVRWVVGDTTSGTGSQQQVHVFVKPTKEGLHTNLVLTTDRRTYHLECHSTTVAILILEINRYRPAVGDQAPGA